MLHSSSMSARVVVSSSEMPMGQACAGWRRPGAATMAGARRLQAQGVEGVSLTGAKPSCQAAARMAV
jgi:hypothetical protein